MVKNEAEILPRFLKSVPKETREVTLCDTGSTDDTLRIAREWSEWSGIPLHIAHAGPFDNFASSRNRCVRAFLKRRRRKSENDYVLLADADYTIGIYSLEMPASDVNVIQVHPLQTHLPHNSLPYLVRESVLYSHCKYRLWTHEFLECSNTPLYSRFEENRTLTHGFYNGLYFQDYADGSTRPQKLVRDINLLRAWLKEKNETDIRPRALYYLARAYQDQGNYKQALAFYKQHLQEERMTNYRYYSHYRIALLHLARNETLEGESALWQSIAEYDGIFRRESYYYLARLNRQRGSFAQCVIIARAGLSSPDIAHERFPLFLEPIIYDWVLEEEYAWCLYKLQHYALAKQHFERIREQHFSSMDFDTQQRIAEEIKACG